MSSTLLGELPRELDLHLELRDDLTVCLPQGGLQESGLRPGQTLIVDVLPLSLRLDCLGAAGEQAGNLPLARVDLDGRIHLPFKPPGLTSPRVLLQLRRRGTCPEVHLLADPR